MAHAADANEFLEISGNELGAVVCDDSRAHPGEFFQGALKDDFNIGLGQGFADLPVNDIPAVAVQDAQKVVEGAGNAEVGQIHVPVGRDASPAVGSLCLYPWPTGFSDGRLLPASIPDTRWPGSPQRHWSRASRTWLCDSHRSCARERPYDGFSFPSFNGGNQRNTQRKHDAAITASKG